MYNIYPSVWDAAGRSGAGMFHGLDSSRNQLKHPRRVQLTKYGVQQGRLALSEPIPCSNTNFRLSTC